MEVVISFSQTPPKGSLKTIARAVELGAEEFGLLYVKRVVFEYRFLETGHVPVFGIDLSIPGWSSAQVDELSSGLGIPFSDPADARKIKDELVAKARQLIIGEARSKELRSRDLLNIVEKK